MGKSRRLGVELVQTTAEIGLLPPDWTEPSNAPERCVVRGVSREFRTF